MSIITFEIEELNKICENVVPNSKIIACTEALIRVDIKQTKSRQLTACLRFPENYPTQHILLELKSRTLASRFLDGLTNIAENKAKDVLGKPQAIYILKFIAQYLQENPLCVVYDEILSIKKLLKTSAAELKLKQKNSSIILTARGGNYYFKIKTEIHEQYPEKCVTWNDYESNLPNVLIRYLNGQAREIARQCVEAPLAIKKVKVHEPFQPSPSLLKTFTFIIEATNDFYMEICPICNSFALPREPENIITNESKDSFVERVYCGHLFHQGCLKKYIHEPPFPPGGKTCPAPKSHPRSDDNHLQRSTTTKMKNLEKNATTTCGIRLAHDRWVVNVKVAESRWAQKQARERELEEVVDFLQ